MNEQLENPPVILVVNDDQVALELLKDLLEPEGYKVFMAQGAQPALEIVSTVRMDLILCDVVMPGMNGMELCRALKNSPKTADVPVLLVSAIRKEEAALLEGFASGADDYLEIPFRQEALLVKVARLAERHRVEKRYRDLVEHAADIIYTRDMDGRITSINEAGARFFGRPTSKLVGTTLSELFGEETASQIIAQTSEGVSDEPLRWVHEVRNAQGDPRYLEGVMTLVMDAEGKPASVRSVVRDITERKLVEDALRESEERFKAFMDNSPAVAFIKDEQGRHTYVNRPFEQFFNLKLEDLQGKTAFDLWPAEVAEKLRENDGAVLATGESVETTETVPAPDGTLQ